MGDLLDLEDTVLDDSLDEQGTVVGLLNSDVNASREAGLGVLKVLGALLLVALVIVLVVQVIGQGGVIKVLLLTDVLDVGDGEADADAKRSDALAAIVEYKRKKIRNRESYFSLPNFLERITSCSPSISFTCHSPCLTISSITCCCSANSGISDVFSCFNSSSSLARRSMSPIFKKKEDQQKTTYAVRNPVDRNFADNSKFNRFILPSDAGALRMLEVEKAA